MLRYISNITGMLDISHLTPAERLDLIGQLWDSLAPEDVHLTPAQDAELARRMASFETDIATAVSFEEIDAELDRQIR